MSLQGLVILQYSGGGAGGKEGAISPPIIRVEGLGWAWMGMDGAWLPKFNKYLRSTTGSTLVSES